MKKLQGIYPAIVTALDADGAFDPIAMRRIVRHQLDAGVDGFYVCGGTGEGLLLTGEERQRAIECVLDEVNGRAGVVAHIGAFQTADTLALARHAGTAGVDAIAALPPAYFYRPDELGLERYYTAVAEASTVPLLIYNIPQRTGIMMTEELFERLLELPNVIGMKDSSGDMGALKAFLSKGDVTIFEGEDSVLLPALQAGASGGIGATYNIMPQLYVALWSAFQSEDADTASGTQSRLNEIMGALEVVDLFGGLKQILAWMGLECGEPRTPNRPLTVGETEKLRRSMEGVGFFDGP